MMLLLLFVCAFAKAQSQQKKLDSLHLALQHAANDTIYMDVLSQIGFYYNHTNNDSSNFYLAQSASIAKKLNLKLFEASVTSAMAYLLAWSNYPKALELSLQALKLANDPLSEKNIWNLTPGRTPHMERLNVLGWIYFNIAQLYGNTDNSEQQISSLLQAKNIADSLQDSALNMLANLNLGNVYFDKLKKPDSSLYFELKALSLFSNSPNSDKSDIGWVYGAIGTVYLEKKDFNSSVKAFQKGLQWMQEQNNLAGIGGLCLALSNFYKTINKPDSSLLYAYKTLEINNTFKDKLGIADAYSALSAAYNEQKRTDSAFAYLTLASALHDSLNNVERKNLLTYQTVSFNEQMRIKNLEDEKIETRNKIRMYALLAGIAVFMLVAFLLYRNNQNRKKANVLLQKQKEEIVIQKENVEQTLIELKSTQAQLVQSEKMASLGELTAGIAHEIQNPLNFVNNFSEVNKEMLEELQAERLKPNAERDEVLQNDLINDVITNEEKINQHGKRADAIVKGMLQHSRQTKGIKEPTDINALCDEYLRLSYHGLRAKDKSFNADFKTDFDESIGKINIVSQDIGRVLLNLFNNAFYAVNEKGRRSTVDSQQLTDNYKPLVTIQTKKQNNKIELKVIDNGNGIPQSIIDKIFQPFFTTKPTGQGTGLGLSLAYDIITKEHNGTIHAESKEDEGTKFIIFLPF